MSDTAPLLAGAVLLFVGAPLVFAGAPLVFDGVTDDVVVWMVKSMLLASNVTFFPSLWMASLPNWAVPR